MNSLNNYIEWMIAVFIAIFVTLTMAVLVFSVGAILVSAIGCSSAPTRTFNAEDKQDGSCYATYGSMLGYCSTNVIDVFNNNHIYDGAE